MNLPSAPAATTNATHEAPQPVDPTAMPAPETPVDAAPETAPATPETTALQRAQAVAEKAKAAAARNRANREERARIEQRAASAEAERERYRVENERLSARDALYKKDPLAAIKELGVPVSEITRRAMEENTPEAREAAMRAEIRAEMEAELGPLRELKTRVESEEHTKLVRAEESAFIRGAGDAAAYPHLAKQPGSVVLAAAKTVLAEVARKHPGVVPSNKELWDYLEYQYATHQNPATPPASDSAASVNQAPSQTRTVSNRQASTRSQVPANFDSLSDREQKAYLAKMLEPHMTKG